MAEKKSSNNAKIGEFLGKAFAHNIECKLYHWRVTGPGSYDRHIALDQALEDMSDILDRITETSIALYGDLNISVPQCDAPKDMVEHCKMFYDYIEESRELFEEDFSTAILDDYQESVQQLLFRMIRLQ